MEFPTLEQVEAADREQICRWYRFLPICREPWQLTIVNRVADRFESLGGFTAALSKQIGWEE